MAHGCVVCGEEHGVYWESTNGWMCKAHYREGKFDVEIEQRLSSLESRLLATDPKALKLEGEIVDLKRTLSETNCELLRVTNAFLMHKMEQPEKPKAIYTWNSQPTGHFY